MSKRTKLFFLSLSVTLLLGLFVSLRADLISLAQPTSGQILESPSVTVSGWCRAGIFLEISGAGVTTPKGETIRWNGYIFDIGLTSGDGAKPIRLKATMGTKTQAIDVSVMVQTPPPIEPLVSGEGLSFMYNPTQPAAPIPASAVLFVDSAFGSDSHNGQTSATAFRSLPKALATVQSGETIVLLPGVYYGAAEITRYASASAPITIRADRNLKNRVVLTQADRTLRENVSGNLWIQESGDLYYTRWDRGGWPTRILYDDIDLYPYPNLDGLRNFMTYIEPAWRTRPYPGPTHGVYWDNVSKRLYVRLKARYGDTNPNHRTMKVGPVPASYKAQEPRAVTDWTLAFKGTGKANYIIEGITFETTGSCGVYINAATSRVTVRNSFFSGVPWGVSGDNNKPDRDVADPFALQSTGAVTIERCVYTQFPTFQDAVEQTERVRAYFGGALPPTGDGQVLENFFWWRRKLGHHSTENDPDPTARRPYQQAMIPYENAIALKAGKNWVIRNNFIYDVLDAFGAYCGDVSVGLEISQNVAARMVDNFVESECHSQDLQVRENLVLDAYEPFSFQPGEGHDWPDGTRIYDNVSTQSAGGRSWFLSIPRKSLQLFTGAFKVMFKTMSNWPSLQAYQQDSDCWLWWMADVPKDIVRLERGFAAYNNTIIHSHGNMLDLAGLQDKISSGFLFLNNLLVVEDASNFDRKGTAYAWDDWVFGSNFLVRSSSNTNVLAPHKELLSAKLGTDGWWYIADQVETRSEALLTIAGGGRVVATLGQLGLTNPANHDYSLFNSSPLRNAGRIEVAGFSLPGIRGDVGAFGYGQQSWMSEILAEFE
jgi:hypothetical protein